MGSCRRCSSALGVVSRRRDVRLQGGPGPIRAHRLNYPDTCLSSLLPSPDSTAAE
ncbi:hypothetical protein Pd630_LPD01415 [Rhodococcus opacus PD630]|nr:hypothetical protein Pd630_LPD01415 [Rhodococcus opacus PD630]